MNPFRKTFERLTLASLSISALVASALSLISIFTPNSLKVQAAGCWEVCQDMYGTEYPGGPGNMSGCSVQFAGEPVPGLGQYDYTCPNPQSSRTCFYDYDCS